MHVALVGFLWVAGLVLALTSSHQLVGYLTRLADHFRLSAGLLGLLVALGADGPEVTAAFIALASGATDIGLGVVVGSNTYNLAGLLGLAAIVAGVIYSGTDALSLDRAVNIVLTILLAALVYASSYHVLLGIVSVLVLLLYAVAEVVGPSRISPRLHEPIEATIERERGEETVHAVRLVVLALACVAGIIAGSNLLVTESIPLGPALGIPRAIVATFVLPIATSLPNTWAAIVLAQRGLARAAIASTFNSNSINAALGAGLPSIVLMLHASRAALILDVPWLLLMTACALLFVATRHTLGRVEGLTLLVLYGVFVVLRVSVVR